MLRLILIAIGFFIFATAATPVDARSGCCSHHAGVRADGCGCNDGTSLSSTCSPYYTCQQSAPAVPVVQKTYRAPAQPAVKKQVYYTPVPTATPTLMPTLTPTPSPIPYKETAKDKKKQFKVLRVIDGDTIVISLRGREEIIQLLGITAPTVAQCYTKEATNKLTEMVNDKFVIVLDDKVSDRDYFNNRLRYIYLPEKPRASVNGEMIKQGYAVVNRDAQFKMLSRFNELEKQADKKSLGWWGACNANPAVKEVKAATAPTKAVQRVVIPTSAPAKPAVQTVQQPVTQSGYTGGDMDCGDFGSHAEAQSFFISQGGPASDPHRLDADHDGSACETLP